MIAGPRFLSLGFIIIFLFCFRACRACVCLYVRLDVARFLFAWLIQVAFRLSCISKLVIASSMYRGAGGGFQVGFFYVDLFNIFRIL
jgi:hypothetical protein